jgi:hypothetical protein
MYKLLLLCLITSISASAQETLLLRSPSVSDTKIAFAYGGDIWSADRDCSNPQRLTVKYCLNGPLPNIPAFYSTFNILPGNKMYLPDSLRGQIW